MEEILASIRRIISEDDTPAGGAAPAPAEEAEAAPEGHVELAPVVGPEPEPADDVLELTDRVDAHGETVGDLEVVAPGEPEPAPAPEPPPSLEPAFRADDDERLVGEPAAHAAASAFGQLSAAIAMPAAGRTLEDVVRELLRPLLKAWLDENLPRIVEGKVAEEVERIARTRVR